MDITNEHLTSTSCFFHRWRDSGTNACPALMDFPIEKRAEDRQGNLESERRPASKQRKAALKRGRKQFEQALDSGAEPIQRTVSVLAEQRLKTQTAEHAGELRWQEKADRPAA